MSEYFEGFLNIALLTVGTDTYTTEMLIRQARVRSWMLDTFHSDEFLSSQKRPSFGPRLQEADRCLVFIDFEKAPDAAAESARFLRETYGDRMLIVAVVRAQVPELILSAMRSGCAELLAEPIQGSALEAVFDKIDQNSESSRKSRSQYGSVLAIVGAKGGVGSTILAVHLATFLAKRSGKRTLLIDYRGYGGHVGVYLGIEGKHYFDDAVRNLQRMDSELLKRFVAHHASGLEVMNSPDVFDVSRAFDADGVRRAIEFLRTEYDYILVDCSRSERNVNRPIFSAAKTIYPVTTPDVASARDLSRFVDELAVMDEWSDKIRIVLNRSNSPLAIPSEQIERATRQRIVVRIPNGYQEMTRAANLGIPLEASAHSEAAAAIVRWSDDIAGSVTKKSRPSRELKVMSIFRHPFAANDSFGT